MGLDGALVFALPDPDARDARWTASGGGWEHRALLRRRLGGRLGRSHAGQSDVPTEARGCERAKRRVARRASTNDLERPGARARASDSAVRSSRACVRRPYSEPRDARCVCGVREGGGGRSKRNEISRALRFQRSSLQPWRVVEPRRSLDRPKSPPGRHSETRGRDDRTRAMTEQKEEPKKNVAVDLECDDEFEEFGNEGAW